MNQQQLVDTIGAPLVARVFFPRARAFAQQLEIEWPEAFEQTTARILQTHLGGEFDIAW